MNVLKGAQGNSLWNSQMLTESSITKLKAYDKHVNVRKRSP
jgi:hypothetical protein